MKADLALAQRAAEAGRIVHQGLEVGPVGVGVGVDLLSVKVRVGVRVGSGLGSGSESGLWVGSV